MRYTVLSPDRLLLGSFPNAAEAVNFALEKHRQTGLSHHVVAALGHTSDRGNGKGGDPIYLGARAYRAPSESVPYETRATIPSPPIPEDAKSS